MSINLAKNTAYLTLATIVQKVLAFVYFTLIARFVGVEWTGKYFFALSFSYIFSVFIDFGLNYVLIREIAKDKSRIQKFISNVFTIKLLLALITFTVGAAIINLTGHDELTIHLVYLALFAVILDSFHLNFYGVFRGVHNLKFESIGVIIYEVIILSFGLGVLIMHPSLALLITALILGSGFHIIYTTILLKKKLGVFPKLELDLKFLIPVFCIAFPFALATIFTKISSYADSVLLNFLSGDAYVGWYSVAYKITYAFQFIPMAFVAALYPAFASAWVGDREKLSQLLVKSLRYMMIIAAPICFGIWSIADKIILAFYGQQYAYSILPLQILIFVLFFIFMDFPIGSLLNACNRQVTKTAITGVTMLINIVLNILLIPQFDVIGASIAGLVSFTFMFFAGLFYAKKIIKFSFSLIAIKAFKILLSGAVMAAAAVIAKNYVSFTIVIPIAAIIYSAMLFALRELRTSDITFLKKIITKQPITD